MPDIKADIEQLVFTADNYCRDSVNRFNEFMKPMTPIETVILTMAAVIVLRYVLDTLREWRKVGIKTLVFRVAVKLPFVSGKVEAEFSKIREDFTKKYGEQRKDCVKKLPEKPMPVDKIMKIVNQGGVDGRHCWKESVISGCVYTNDEDHWSFINKCMEPYVQTNALHMDEYKRVTQMEAEILRMGCNMYNGDDKTCGVLTSGGTESILLAMLCYRQHGLSKGITKPNIVLSNAAHAAFDKACFLFQIEMRKVPVTKDFKMDWSAMKAQIDSNTVALVASSPEYPYGTYDPVPKVAAYAMKLGIGMHNDCCLGSFVNPYVEDVGYKLPHVFDFRCPGVTSISCDPHKYGLGPKGVSMLLFKNKEWRDYQFFCTPRWNGGLYCTTTLAGSRPGNIIVGTWAVMMKIGREGYVRNAKVILDACVKLKRAIQEEIPELSYASDDVSCVATIVGNGQKDGINPIAMKPLLAKHGFILSPVQTPAGLHISMTMGIAGRIDKLVDALKSVVKEMKANPSLNTNETVATYGMTASVPDDRFLNDLLKIHSQCLLDTLN